jgi:5-methylcytosine-specific restriction endonuclease McrA
MSERKRYSDYELGLIFDRTSGLCHVCQKKLAFSNHGIFGARAAWEVEHSVPVARGGTNHLNNLYAACIPCNREKSTVGSRAARAWHGNRRAPLSRERRSAAKRSTAVAGALLLGFLGASLAGPFGALAGGVIGAAIGHDQNPDN